MTWPLVDFLCGFPRKKIHFLLANSFLQEYSALVRGQIILTQLTNLESRNFFGEHLRGHFQLYLIFGQDIPLFLFRVFALISGLQETCIWRILNILYPVGYSVSSRIFGIQPDIRYLARYPAKQKKSVSGIFGESCIWPSTKVGYPGVGYSANLITAYPRSLDHFI